MSQYKTERILAWLYGFITLLMVICVVCVSVVFTHWKNTLDVCPGSYLENLSCGCIFYGLSTFQYFNGGHNSYCYYAIFAPLPVVAYALLLWLYHSYRVCINNVGQYEDEKSTAVDEIEGDVIVMTSRARVARQNDTVIYCWVPTAVFAAVFALYTLIHASIMTDGFNKTCTQYRGNLVRVLQASGDQATAILFRLDCQAIFDHMDYLLKDPRDLRRADFIQTGAALHIALISSWICVFLWITVAVYTSLRAYKEREVLGCCSN